MKTHQSVTIKMAKTGEIGQTMPWASVTAPCPWDKANYERIVIPGQHGKKLCKVQIVHRRNFSIVRERPSLAALKTPYGKFDPKTNANHLFGKMGKAHA